MKTLLLAAALLAGLFASSYQEALDQAAVDGFVNDMVQQHQFARSELDELFKQTHLSSSVLTAIARPAESKQWYQYRPIFLTDTRTADGVSFWFRYGQVLGDVERTYGVPREIIVAIIGVETFYGRRSGDYRVLDALSTLAFNYPPRAAYFRSELENYLLMTRDQGVNPLDLTGSYAGAMGMPQFMPSSFRNFAVDYDKDNRIDIWSNAADAIASVGNYLKLHGWEPGQPVAAQAYLNAPNVIEPFRKRMGSAIPLEELRNAGITTALALPGNPAVGLLELTGEQASEYWLTLKNFSVIQTYNRSALYAMAVYQLSAAIRNEYDRRLRLSGDLK
jgi:membrane-bound lytic murein transglycosylase B